MKAKVTLDLYIDSTWSSKVTEHISIGNDKTLDVLKEEGSTDEEIEAMISSNIVNAYVLLKSKIDKLCGNVLPKFKLNETIRLGILEEKRKANDLDTELWKTKRDLGKLQEKYAKLDCEFKGVIRMGNAQDGIDMIAQAAEKESEDVIEEPVQVLPSMPCPSEEQSEDS